MPVENENESRYIALAQIAAPIYAQRRTLPGTDEKAMDDAINDAVKLMVRCSDRVIRMFK